VADEQKAALKKAAGVSGGKDECQVRLKGTERNYWMGTEIGMLGGCGVRGQVTAGDGLDKQGKMKAGYNSLRRKKKKQQCKVGRKEEGSSSNRPELAAFLLALRDMLIEERLLFLCDNQSLLKAVNRWIGEVGKATLVGAPDFTCRKLCCEAGKVTYQDRHSTFNNSVMDTIRRGAAENEVQKHEEKLTGAWRQMSTLRRRYEKWCKGDDTEDCTHKQRYEASYQSMVKVLKQNTWIDDRKLLKSCARARAEQGNVNHVAYGTWTADFMLRQNESRAFIWKYSNDPRVPWRHKRCEMMAIAGIIPVAKWLAKIKQRSDVSCRLCKRAREQCGASTENLPEETYGHINSAFCDGMA